MVREQTCVILGRFTCYIFSGSFGSRGYKYNFFIAVFTFHRFFSEKLAEGNERQRMKERGIKGSPSTQNVARSALAS
jgi:hypothetical protein